MRSKYRNSLASEGLHIMWYSQAYFCVKRSPPLIAIVAQMNLFTPLHPASWISIFIILLSMPAHPHGLFSFSVSTKTPQRFLFSSPLACIIPHSSLSYWYCHHKVWHWMQIMKPCRRSLRTWMQAICNLMSYCVFSHVTVMDE